MFGFSLVKHCLLIYYVGGTIRILVAQGFAIIVEFSSLGVAYWIYI